jgi:hypothetical protein
MQGKLNKLVPLTETPIDGADTIIVDVTVNKEGSVQVLYGAGSTGDLSLSASNDPDPATFAVIEESVQTMDIGGGSHMWNIGNMYFKYLAVNLPAGGLDQSVLFAGNTPDLRS